jgi:hypothetical protein
MQSNFCKPDHIDDRTWKLFCEMVIHAIHDIQVCTALGGSGSQGINFTESKMFFKKGGGLHEWLDMLGISRANTTWEQIRKKGWDMAHEKEEQILTRRREREISRSNQSA